MVMKQVETLVVSSKEGSGMSHSLFRVARRLRNAAINLRANRPSRAAEGGCVPYRLIGIFVIQLLSIFVGSRLTRAYGHASK